MSGSNEVAENLSAPVDSASAADNALVQEAVNLAFGRGNENMDSPVDNKIPAAVEKVNECFNNVSWINRTLFGASLEKEAEQLIAIFTALSPADRAAVSKKAGADGGQLFISRVKDTFGEHSSAYAILDDLLLDDSGNKHLRSAVRMHSLIAQINEAHAKKPQSDSGNTSDSKITDLEGTLLQMIGEIPAADISDVRREFRIRYGDELDEQILERTNLTPSARTAAETGLNDDVHHVHEIIRQFKQKAQYQKALGEFAGIYLGPYILGGMPRVIENWKVGGERAALESDLISVLSGMTPDRLEHFRESYIKSVGERLEDVVSSNDMFSDEAKKSLLDLLG